MREDVALLDALARTAEPAVVDAIRTVLDRGSDEELARLDPIAFADAWSLEEDSAISAFVRGTRIGLFDMSWNVLCPGCGGVVEATRALGDLRSGGYRCALCSRDAEPVLDDAVEVRFIASRRVRPIAAHDPARLSFWDYHRQMFVGLGVRLPPKARFDELATRALLQGAELGDGAAADMDVVAESDPMVVFDPVTHTSQPVVVDGSATRDTQAVTVVFDGARMRPTPVVVRPGPVRFSIRNRTGLRILPGVFVIGEDLSRLLADHRPFLSAKRLLCNQAFRDQYRADSVRFDQRLKITSLTFLFTDLRGSTDLYAQVGDLAAYDLVRSHFALLGEVVANEGGAVVKTIGDAVMAVFPTPEKGVAAAFKTREAMDRLNAAHGTDLALRIGLHQGPCLAVNLDERQDFFGQTVNVASRIQASASQGAILISESVVQQPRVAGLLPSPPSQLESRSLALRGVREAVPVIVIP